MGFLDGLGRFITGKPVFQTDESSAMQQSQAPRPDEQPASPQTDSFGSPIDQSGHVIIPEIEVEDVRTHRHGDEMEVTAWITNCSEQQVRIDYCMMIGQKRLLNYELTSHQAHELVLYEGHVPKNNAYTRAELVFRLLNGHQFDHVYYVKYHLEGDGVYLVDELHTDGPVRNM